MIMCIQNGALLYVCMYVYVCHVHVWCTIHTCAVIICMHIQNLKSTGILRTHVVHDYMKSYTYLLTSGFF